MQSTEKLKLSIITVNLNNSGGLKKTIKSVLSQSYSNLEHIIIDGGSVDGSIDYIKKIESEYKLKNIKLSWISESDSGIYNGMNKGIMRATGNYCNFLNSGDWFYNENTLIDILGGTNNEDVLYGAAVGLNDTEIHYPPSTLSLLDLFRQNIINHQASFIKTSLLKERLYSEHFKIASDWEFFFICMINNKTFKSLNVPICYYSPDGVSRADKYKKLHAEEREFVIKSHLPQAVINDYNLLVKLRFNRLYFNFIKILDNKKTIKITAFFMSMITRLFSNKQQNG